MEVENYIPGMRIALRDAEWRIDRVDRPSHGGMLLTCTGQSELVRGITGKFLTELEDNTQILSPETTKLEDDLSSGYAATQLYIDALLQTAPPADGNIHLGHQAAMDLLPYQLDPALQALKQTRPRILIADSVGLGKTLGAGILMTELIRRNRGKRILVLAVKSMLSQFQREMWQRFTIPLVRLDSVGLQRMRNTIPANHNPFHYIDRAIISIDTLKQNLEYRHYLEQCHWDIVVIDEAHNVAQRSSNSLRHRLAQLLCTRCDAMLMLSATPHDGKPESFASLIHMLDPTAIPDAKNYAHEDYKSRGLVIRRFKKDVAEQLKTALPERDVHTPQATATVKEAHAFATVREATFKTLNKGSAGAGQLFRTTLEKALLSSPAACISTVEKRLNKLQKKAEKSDSADIQHDIDMLQSIHAAVSGVDIKAFAKYQHLLDMLGAKGEHSIGWNPKEEKDRIVLFTESVVTLEFLEQHLPAGLKIKNTKSKKQFAILHGGLKDTDIADTVNSFNRGSDALRLLICSDVASEGLNLHHCSHRLIHFDIPWSLMVFQQRNGRVDRYGQTQPPQIYYLTTSTSGDERVLEVLIEKDSTASKNLGDPSEFGTQEEQEEMTATAFESGASALDFGAMFDNMKKDANTDLAAFDSPETPTRHTDVPNVTSDNEGVHGNARQFLTAGLSWLQQSGAKITWSEEDGAIVLEAPADLQSSTNKRLPREAVPKDYRFILTDNKDRIMQDMQLARDEESPSFGDLQYLWPMHPVLGWMRQRIADAFGRHTAPVMRLPKKLAADEHWFLAHGGFPNKRGQALIQDQVAVQFKDEQVTDLLPLTECLQKLGITGDKIPNRAESQNCEELMLYLPDVVTYLKQHLQGLRKTTIADMQKQVDAELSNLTKLRGKHIQQLDLELTQSSEAETRKQKRREAKQKQIDEHFTDYERWLKDTVATEDEPYIQIVAVITGSEGERLS